MTSIYLGNTTSGPGPGGAFPWPAVSGRNGFREQIKAQGERRGEHDDKSQLMIDDWHPIKVIWRTSTSGRTMTIA